MSIPARSSLLRPTALLVMAAVIPLMVFAAVVAGSSLQRERRDAEERAITEARRALEAIDRELAISLDAVTGLADAPALDRPDPAAFAELAARTHARHPIWLNVLLLDPQGRRLFGAPRDPDEARPIEPDSLAEAVQTRRPVIGSIAKGPRRWGVPLRAPVVRDGRLQGVVTAVMAPDRIHQALDKARLPPGWIASVLDRRGLIVARNVREARFLGVRASERAIRYRALSQSGVYAGRTLEGVGTVSAFWRSEQTGWSVHVGIPRTEFDAPLVRTLLLTIAALIASLLLAGLFAFLVHREFELRRRAAESAEQTHRLEALGRLTGGVAHDFNNLLMVIRGNADMLERRLKAPEAERPLAAIRMAIDRAARMTRQLLVFARGGAAAAAPIDLNAVVTDFLGALGEAAGPDITIEAQLDETRPWIEVDQVQLEVALLNMAINARDAMEGAGVIVVCTLARGDTVEVRFRDTGPGFRPADIPSVFDPFFTTKPPSDGTGLGLTQVHSFTRQAGGSVRIEPAKGRGAEVVMTFPAAPSPSAPQGPQVGEAVDPGRLRGLKVLVVDDNAEVRQVTAETLAEMGMAVTEAADGQAAISRLEADRGFDMVLSDIVMPGAISGLVLAREIMARWPGLPVLLASGYSASAEEARAEGLPVLGKPYEVDDLVRALLRLKARA